MCPHTLILAAFCEGFFEGTIVSALWSYFLRGVNVDWIRQQGGGAVDNKWIGPIGPIVAQKVFFAGLIFRGSLFLEGLIGGSFAFQNADWAWK